MLIVALRDVLLVIVFSPAPFLKGGRKINVNVNEAKNCVCLQLCQTAHAFSSKDFARCLFYPYLIAFPRCARCSESFKFEQKTSLEDFIYNVLKKKMSSESFSVIPPRIVIPIPGSLVKKCANKLTLSSVFSFETGSQEAPRFFIEQNI